MWGLNLNFQGKLVWLFSHIFILWPNSHNYNLWLYRHILTIWLYLHIIRKNIWGLIMEQLISSSKSLGKVLQRQRKAKNLTQEQAGRPFKIEQSTVSDIERGASGTRLETLFRMLAALDLELVIRTKDVAIKDTSGMGW